MFNRFPSYLNKKEHDLAIIRPRWTMKGDEFKVELPRNSGLDYQEEDED